MPWNPQPIVKSGTAYLAAAVLILFALLFFGIFFGGYVSVVGGLVWYAARPKTG